LGLHRSVVLRAVQRGRIAGRKVGPRAWIVTRDEVEAYDLSRRAGPPRGPRPPRATTTLA
jgi:hypothetical protein